jgi:hypothetical protein
LQNKSALILIITGSITKKVPCDEAATGLNGIETIITQPGQAGIEY